MPDAEPYDASHSTSRLTVPNQDIPYNDGPQHQFGFIGRSSLFRLADGSMIDFKTKKIVLDPNIKFKAAGYWNDPNSNVGHYGAEWEKTETIESLMARIGEDGHVEDPNLSPESIRYWKMAKEESEKLEQNLTDEQKAMLDELNSGKILRLTKLVEVDGNG